MKESAIASDCRYRQNPHRMGRKHCGKRGVIPAEAKTVNSRTEADLNEAARGGRFAC